MHAPPSTPSVSLECRVSSGVQAQPVHVHMHRGEEEQRVGGDEGSDDMGNFISSDQNCTADALGDVQCAIDNAIERITMQRCAIERTEG